MKVFFIRKTSHFNPTQKEAELNSEMVTKIRKRLAIWGDKLAAVVQINGSSIHWINYKPVDSHLHDFDGANSNDAADEPGS